MSHRALNVFVWVILAMLCVSVTANVQQAERIDGFLAAAGRRHTRVGEAAVPLRGLRQGQPAEIRFDTGLPTVVYFFRTTCGWCVKNWPAVSALQSAAPGRFRLVAVTTERSTAEALSEVAPSVDVLEAFEPESRAAWRFSATPHTVVVSGQGVITHDWPGLYTDGIASEIEDLFDLRLPRVPAR